VKTISLSEPGKLSLIDTAPPESTPAGYAKVRVHRVGVCGTDYHAFHGRQPFFSYPRIIGHELGVEILAINDPAGATKLSVGDHCAVEPYLNCGKCIACRRGRQNCCTHLQVMGVHVDGGMREQVLIPIAKLHRSKKLSMEQLALVETLGIGCHAVDRAQPTAGETALVIGAGPIGLSVIPFLQAAGAKVLVTDVSASRLEFCRKAMKVDGVLDAGKDIIPDLGELPTIVFDATGNAKSMMKAFDFVAPGGRLVFVGLFQGDVTFADPQFHRREMTLLATRNSLPRDFERIIKLVEDGVIDTGPWITHRAKAERILEAFPLWISPQAGVIKAVVEF
jgi:2-desacetyl-2-hydroxyethyl bacteriochlorophyllide A dehydrogenase